MLAVPMCLKLVERSVSVHQKRSVSSNVQSWILFSVLLRRLSWFPDDARIVETEGRQVEANMEQEMNIRPNRMIGHLR